MTHTFAIDTTPPCRYAIAAYRFAVATRLCRRAVVFLFLLVLPRWVDISLPLVTLISLASRHALR